MGPTNNLGYLIQHLAAVMGRQTDQLLQEQLDIGLSQFKILMVLEWNPRVQQKAIAEALGQTEASISRQIKLLQDKGLLITKADSQNRRRHITTPTTRGVRITEAASAIMNRNFSEEYASMSEGQLVELASGLQQLHRLACQPGKSGACGHTLGF